MIHEYIKQIKNFSTIQPKIVLEIGALDGEYSRIIQSNFDLNEEDLYLIEANPDLLDSLQKNFPAAHNMNLAISDKDGHYQFNKVVSSNKMKVSGSSLLERVDGWNRNLKYERIEVQSITGKTLVEKINRDVDICIIDVEGLSYEVLKSFSKKLVTIKSLMIECEHVKIFKGQKLYSDVHNLLSRNNFRQMAFKYSYANQSDSVWIQEPYVDLAYKYWPVKD